MFSQFHRLLPTASWTRALFAPVIIFVACCVERNYQTDFWHHLARGRTIAESGSLIDRDLFTYTVPGRSFRDANWLSHNPVGRSPKAEESALQIGVPSKLRRTIWRAAKPLPIQDFRGCPPSSCAIWRDPPSSSFVLSQPSGFPRTVLWLVTVLRVKGIFWATFKCRPRWGLRLWTIALAMVSSLWATAIVAAALADFPPGHESGIQGLADRVVTDCGQGGHAGYRTLRTC